MSRVVAFTALSSITTMVFLLEPREGSGLDLPVYPHGKGRTQLLLSLHDITRLQTTVLIMSKMK